MVSKSLSFILLKTLTSIISGPEEYNGLSQNIVKMVWRPFPKVFSFKINIKTSTIPRGVRNLPHKFHLCLIMVIKRWVCLTGPLSLLILFIMYYGCYCSMFIIVIMVLCLSMFLNILKRDGWMDEGWVDI